MQALEFQTPTGKRVMVLPSAIVGLAEGMTSDAESPVTWIHTTNSASFTVAGSIDTIAAAVSGDGSYATGFHNRQPKPAESASTAELEFMRLARVRAELKLAKLQGPAVGRNGRRRTGSGER